MTTEEQNNLYSSALFQELEMENTGFSYKRLILLMLDKWHWILIGILVGIVGGIFFSQVKMHQFSNNAKILVPETNSASDLSNIFENTLKGSLTGGSAISNEIDILQSYTLTHEAIEHLNWRTAWYQKQWLRWNGLYTHEPFQVEEIGNNKNVEGIDLYISPVNSNEYKIEVDGKAKLSSTSAEPVKIKFSATVQFDQLFQNRYFSFIIHKTNPKVGLVGQSYKFHFLNVRQLTYDYLKRLSISQTSKEGDVLKLSIQGTEPLRDIHFLNELIKVYMNRKLQLATQTKKRTLQFINNQLSGISDSLHQFGSNFSKFRSENQIIDISAQGQQAMDQLSQLENERSQQKMQLNYFKNLLSYLKNSEQIRQMASPSVVGVKDPGLNSLVLTLSQLYSQREVLTFSARDSNPRLILLNKEIDQTTRQLRANLLNLIDNAQLSIQSLNQQYNTINQKINHLPKKEQEYINIKQQYELTNQVYTYLLQKRSETEVGLAATVVNVQIIDPAQLDRTEKIGPTSKKIIISGFFLGLLVPIFLIIGIDSVDDRIQMQDDVEKRTKLSILGNVLHCTEKSELVVSIDPSAPISESFRTIRTNLQYKLIQQNHQVIGIHSVRPGEGKTFTATNLASILAMNDKKIVLIGADIRKPRLHQIFDLKHSKKGLSSYLIGQNVLTEVICSTSVKNLDMIPSGPIPPNPAELLGNSRFAELIRELKATYDYIIIDNAPVSMVTDGQVTGQMCDLNLFILRYDVSRKEELKFINELAAKETMPNIALIINDIKATKFGYNYGYGYGRGYKYAYKTTKKSKFTFSYFRNRKNR